VCCRLAISTYGRTLVGVTVSSLHPTPEVPGLSVAVVARRLGVSPSTLRTWDRRYGLGPGAHADGSHRRYTAEDLARLLYMQRLVRDGVRVADAATAARDWSVDLAILEEPDDTPVTSADASDPSKDAMVRGLSAAVNALDARTSASIIRKSLETRGVIWTWDEVLRPVLVNVGRAWARTGTGVEVEHMLSHVAASELTTLVARFAPRSPRPALLACAPTEDHCLPLYAVAAALAERGMEARVLGPRTPVTALYSAVRRLGPSSVLWWAYLPVAEPDDLVNIPRIRPEPLIIAAGPGWVEDLPSDVVRVGDLSSAATRLLRAV